MVTLGDPHYVSTLPLYYSLWTRQGGDLTLVSAGMTELTDRLASKELDAGPIAPAEYLNNPGRYTVVPNLALSSLGRSLSVSLFSKRPAYELANARIAVPLKARGPVALLRWLMREMYHFDPLLVPRTGGLKESMVDNDGVLLFQDAALQAHASTSDLYHVWDLGEAWWQITNTPLLHMLWVAQSDLTAPEFAAIERLFAEAKVAMANRRAEILDEAEQQTSLSRSHLDGYFARFQFDFTSAQQQSLNLYRHTVATLI